MFKNKTRLLLVIGILLSIGNVSYAGSSPPVVAEEPTIKINPEVKNYDVTVNDSYGSLQEYPVVCHAAQASLYEAQGENEYGIDKPCGILRNKSMIAVLRGLPDKRSWSIGNLHITDVKKNDRLPDSLKYPDIGYGLWN